MSKVAITAEVFEPFIYWLFAVRQSGSLDDVTPATSIETIHLTSLLYQDSDAAFTEHIRQTAYSALALRDKMTHILENRHEPANCS